LTAEEVFANPAHLIAASLIQSRHDANATPAATTPGTYLVLTQGQVHRLPIYIQYQTHFYLSVESCVQAALHSLIICCFLDSPKTRISFLPSLDCCIVFVYSLVHITITPPLPCLLHLLDRQVSIAKLASAYIGALQWLEAVPGISFYFLYSQLSSRRPMRFETQLRY
jgi:hypothetical protein